MAQPPGHPYFLPDEHQPHLKKVALGLAQRAMKRFLATPGGDEVDRFAQAHLTALLDRSAREARAPFLQVSVLERTLTGEGAGCGPAILAATAHIPRVISAPLSFPHTGLWHDPVRGLVVWSGRPITVTVHADRIELVVEGRGLPGCRITFRAGRRLPEVAGPHPVEDVRVIWLRTRASGITGVPDLTGIDDPDHVASASLREATRLLGLAVPAWVGSVATTTESLRLGAAGPWRPRQLVLPADAVHPIALAEALVRAEQDNRVRGTALLAPVGDTDEVARTAGSAMAAVFYTNLMALGHARVDGATLRRRDEVLAQLTEELATVRATRAGRGILEGAHALQAWCRRVPSRVVHHRALSRSRRILVVNLDFGDFVYSWMVEHRVCEAAMRRRHVVDLVAVDPAAARDLSHELGLPHIPHTVFEGEERRFEAEDIPEILAALDELLAAHTYQGAVLNCPAVVLAHLVDHPAQPLRGIPISVYDRHLHRGVEVLTAEPTLSHLNAHTVRVFALQSTELHAFDRDRLAAAGFVGERVRFEPWPVDLHFLAPVVPPVRPEASPLTLFAGGNSGRDYDTLFAAVRDRDVHLRIASTLSLDGVPDNVEVLGRLSLSAFAKETRDADVFVVTVDPRFGVTGITVVALAMALGKPVIASDTPAVAQYVTDGVDGILVPTEDEAALGAALERLRDPAERTRIGAAARQTALKRWTLEAFVHRLLGFLEQPTGEPLDRPVELSAHSPTATPSAPLEIVLYTDQDRDWDWHQTRDLQRDMAAAGNRVTVRSSDREGEGARAIAELDPDLVVVNSMGVACELYEALWRAQLPAPREVLLVDFHMLGRAQELYDLFHRPGTRRIEGTWWPSPMFHIQTLYPTFEYLYVNAGVPPGAVHYMPIPASPSIHAPGPDPLGSDYFIGGGLNDRRPDEFLAAVRGLRTPPRHRPRYVGAADADTMARAGIEHMPRQEYFDFVRMLQKARFVVINFAVREHCTAGLSMANLASLAGRPIVSTDADPVRDSFEELGHVLYVPAADEAALTAAIALLDTDDALIAQMHRHALRWRERVSAQKWAARILSDLEVWRSG